MQFFDGLLALDRMEAAVLKVKERLLRATAALEKIHVPYAVAGGNAVGVWVEQADESAVRATQDVDLIVRRSDFDRTSAALASVGFIPRKVAGIELFLDGPSAKARDAVHVLFFGEKVRPEYVVPAPDESETASFGPYRVLTLEALVRMKLTSFRRKYQVHLQDLIGVGLVDRTWLGRIPPELADPLRELLDNPDS